MNENETRNLIEQIIKECLGSRLLPMGETKESVQAQAIRDYLIDRTCRDVKRLEMLPEWRGDPEQLAELKARIDDLEDVQGVASRKLFAVWRWEIRVRKVK